MRSLMGIETEYAVGVSSADDQNASFADSQICNETRVEELISAARKRLVHLPDLAQGLHLANGSRFYIDSGFHPELSTPECTDPRDVVRYVLAGEQILCDLASDVRARVGPIAIFKGNVDYADTNASWGCHESYLHTCSPSEVFDQIVPHLVSRVIFCGAGGFVPWSTGIDFTLSPRASYISCVVSNNSVNDRGIFHSKDEPLSRSGYHRLHLVCGESLCSKTAMWLRIATTALVLAMVDQGLRPGRAVSLSSPLEALRTIAADQTCSATVEMTGGPPLTPLEIQYHYLALAERHLGDPFMPAWADDVCRCWRRVLNELLDAPQSVATTLDWAIKRALYHNHARARGVEWESLKHWNRVLMRLNRVLETSEYWRTPLTAGFVLAERSPLRHTVTSSEPYLIEHGLSWGDLDRVLALRKELFEIDTRFGQLGSDGIFTRLERTGVLDHHVAGIDDIESAMTNPPATGRAHIRGKVIRRLAGGDSQPKADWQGVVDLANRRVLDLSEPFESEERWLTFAEAQVNAPAWLGDYLYYWDPEPWATRREGD